jgi:hypothetical protein
MIMTEEEEFLEAIECAECGDLIEESSPFFAYSERHILCFECAIRRGALYDVRRDVWTKGPSLEGLSGLPEEWHPTL